ncbi:MAG: GWxTD domain-containing protein [Ignavibacteriaceae bacterium]|nr:GWxTD domain-containing protein [Ignavibacteriaceae bacterium]
MKPFLIVLFLSFSYYHALPQSNHSIFEFDYAQFGYDSVSNYLEIYYSFNQSRLTPDLKDNKKYLEGILDINLADSSSGKVLLNKEWKIDHPTNDSDQTNKDLVGVIGMKIPDGNYKFIVGGGNNQKANEKFSTENLKVHHYYDSTISISDIQLASNIIQDSPNQTSMFYKNSLEVIPAPTIVFGANRPVVFYYSEIYNLNKLAKDHNLKVFEIVYNSKNQLLSRKVRTFPSGLKSKVEIGSVVINKYPTDAYTLVLSVIDSVGNYGVSSSKKFFVYNPDVIAAKDTTLKSNTSSLSSEFGAMSEEELDDIWVKSRYKAVPLEIKSFATLKGIDSKRQFLYEFWKKRDSDPSTPENETLREYLTRIDESNKRFGTMSKIGWKTDRGRVYILYGEPSEIERFPNQMDTKPYEIWHYNDIEGGVIFVFADLSGFSDYMLIHSTMRGELRDDNWQDRITQL